MSRFASLVGFELRHYFRRPSTHIYFALYFAAAAFLALLEAGAIPGATLGIGGAGGQVKSNSPFVVQVLVTVVSLFAPIIIAAICGNAAQRDYQVGIHPLIFTTPVGKATFIASRYAASVITTGYVLASIPLGIWAGMASPWADENRLQAFRFDVFAWPWLTSVLPLAIVVGALFFALAATTRQMLPNYLGGLVMLAGWFIAARLSTDTERREIVQYFDPYGFLAGGDATKYWTPVERNLHLMPLEREFLINRAIWFGIALVILVVMLARFRFAHVANERMDSSRRREEWAEQSSEWHGAVARREGALEASRSFGPGAWLRQVVAVMAVGLRSILSSVYFYAILGLSLLFLVLSSLSLDSIYGTAIWPVTRAVVEVTSGTMALFTLIILVLYAGELAWQERDRNMQQVVDVTPAPAWVPFVGKTLALMSIVVLLHAGLMAAGMLIQVSKGYAKFELSLYASELFGIRLIGIALNVIVIMAIHALVNNKYMGHFVAILFLVGNSILLPLMGFQHNLYQYGGNPGTPYSDMDRYGFSLRAFSWFELYWGLVALAIAVLTSVLWQRGQETQLLWRLRVARQSMSRNARAVLALAVAGVLATGTFIFWNTNVRNEYRTSFQGEELQARYERDYKQYESLPQPRITASSLTVTLWPKEGRAQAAGTLTARNKTDVPIPAVHVQLPAEAEVSALRFAPPAKETKRDEELGYFIWTFEKPLMPGESFTLDYDLGYAPSGFSNSGTRTIVSENGTFINSAVLPSFGYSAGGELADDDRRRKHDLPPKERMAPVDDLKARANTYISHDADWIDFAATVCTDPDQLAIAPGYLEREFEKDGRRCFEYAMDAPILNFYSFLSARYVVQRDSWHDVAIEVWHHPGHEYNVETMIEGTKKALDYYTTHFTPYQHRQLRIVEFPRFASFAQSFPNTIPYSESIGFIARVKDPAEDIDYPFYVTAHEVAHQWFAHQVIGGDVQGSTMLSESFSQYAALKVMEAEYGRPTMVKFLKYERDQYLGGRTVERKKELPLLLVENQQYIHYNKGSVVLYAIADYIGEDRFNAALKSYLEKVRFQEPPYTNSLEFLAELRAVTPPDLQYLLDDMLANITLYDLRTTSAIAAKQADGTWETTLEIDARKLRADESGNEAEVPMNDLIDVGAYLEGPGGKIQDLQPLAVQRMRLASGKQTVKLKTSQRPDKAGVNQRLLLLDRIDSDDLIKVEDPKS